MSEDTGRLVALEAKVAALEAALQGQQDRQDGAPERDGGTRLDGRNRPKTTASPASSSQTVTRRGLMRSSGAAAAGAAAGAMLASAQPAGAQQIPASDVTFVATGGVEADNVQGALAEVDLDKASLSGADFGGIVKMIQAQFIIRPWYDIRAYGAIGDGTTDDTTAISDAINVAAAFGGGTVLLPPGVYRFTAPITVPAGVDLWGCGGHHQSNSNHGTSLLAGNGAAQLIIQGIGGQSGNFLLDGQGANQQSDKGLLYLDGPVDRIFTALRVGRAGKDGIVTERTYNCTFLQLAVSECQDNGLVLDTDTADNVFLRAELLKSGASNLTVRHTVSTGTSAPIKNHFMKCLIEKSRTPDIEAQMMVTAGFDNLFTFCGFHAGDTAPATGFLVVADGDLSLKFDSCQFGGPHVNLGSLHFLGNSRADFLGHCIFATGVQGGNGPGIAWDSTGNIRTAALMDFRNNNGWVTSTGRNQNTPFETGYMRVNTQDEATFNPTLDGAQAALYVKDNKLVVGYMDGSTMRYRTMPLTGTSATWTHSTTPP